MISTPATLFLQTPLPPQGGQAARAADSQGLPDFAGLLARFVASSLPATALSAATDIPAPAASAPDEAPVKTDCRDKAADCTEARKPESPDDTKDTSVSEHPVRERPEPTEQIALAAPETSTPPAIETAPTPAAQPAQPTADIRVSQPASTSAPQPADRSVAQGAQPSVPTKDGEAPPTQLARPQQVLGGDSLRAQVVDNGATDQLPQFGHTLSSRSAIVAQSDAGSAALAKDSGTAPKAVPTDQATASLLGGTAQTSSIAAQRAKGPARPGNAASSGQNAKGSQANQAAGQAAGQAATGQAIQQAAAPQSQSGFGNALAGTADGATQATLPTGQSPRSEPLSPVGSDGPSTPQSTLRGTESAAAPKPRTPVPPRFIANQVAVQIQKSVSQGNDRITIQLKPAELGKVEVKLDVGSDGKVSAVITADRADTLDLLQRDARILQNSLQDAGLRADSNSLSFELRGNGQSFADAQSEAPANGSPDASGLEDTAVPDAAASAARSGFIGTDRVDIHV